MGFTEIINKSELMIYCSN